eukprot:jgi/Galph1/1147/GphlegSOOS_G5826.1
MVFEKFQRNVENMVYTVLFQLAGYLYSSYDFFPLISPRDVKLSETLRSKEQYYGVENELLWKSPRRILFRLLLWFLSLCLFSFLLVLGIKTICSTPATTVRVPLDHSRDNVGTVCLPFNHPELTAELQNVKVLLAANLKDVESLLPFFTQQMVRLKEYINPNNIFVSIYESGSVDRSQTLLNQLKSTLDSNGIQNRIVFGNLTRKKGENRIKFLSSLRNQAISVLDDNLFSPDFIIFSNDVFFCAEHLIRLVYRGLKGGDLVCAVDFNEENYFYDTWVARDSRGMPLRGSRGCSVFEASADVQLCEQGHAVPVHSCWNGLVILRSSIFINSGIRFRYVEDEEKECAGSECTLLCNDLWRKGHHSIYVDPGIKVSYHAHVFRELEREHPVLNESSFQILKTQQLVPFDPPPSFFCSPLPPRSVRDDPNLNVAYFAPVL